LVFKEMLGLSIRPQFIHKHLKKYSNLTGSPRPLLILEI
jgi:hypothetical protein